MHNTTQSNSAPSQSASSKDTVLLLSDDPAIRDSLVRLLQEANYCVVESGQDESPSDLAAKIQPDLIIVARARENLTLDKQIRRLLKNSDLPPIVAFGSPIEENDEDGDRESPVFVCLSHHVSPEDRLRVLEAAGKYRAVVKDNQLIRSEAERVCFDLLRAFGETTEKLHLRTEEVHRIQSILEDTHARILKAFM